SGSVCRGYGGRVVLGPCGHHVARRADRHSAGKSKSGAALLEKLEKLSDVDLEVLNRFLAEWSVRDALAVLDEIDRRLAVVEGAIGALRRQYGGRAEDTSSTRDTGPVGCSGPSSNRQNMFPT